MKPQPRYQPGDKIGGRYQVHRALMGGMGEVYLCLDLEKTYPFALKTFQRRYLTDPKKLQAIFEQEVVTWVALEKHSNIVRCFYMDILDNQPFMVLEWIAGEEGKGADLRGWLRRGPLDLRQALDFTIDICRGLIHAQEKQKGLVHRDLKPENILVAQGGLAKITDFGLAQIVETAGLEIAEAGAESEGRQSKVGRRGIAGTPAYMAPEQWRGERLDEQTDIYALGCILYEMLSGQPPFRVDFEPNTPQRVQQWLSEMQARHERGRLPTLPSNLPPGLGDLLQICLAKARAERSASLSELLNQLEGLYRRQFTAAPRAVADIGKFTAVDYNNRAATYNNLGQYQAALADFGRAIALDPNLAQVHYNRGITYDALRQYEAALIDFGRAIELDPTLVRAYYNRGTACYALQQYEAALVDYGRAIELDPNYAQAYHNRGNTYAELQQYQAALGDYERAIAFEPNDATTYYNRGNTYDALLQYEAALADYDRAIELDPNYAEAYNSSLD